MNGWAIQHPIVLIRDGRYLALPTWFKRYPSHWLPNMVLRSYHSHYYQLPSDHWLPNHCGNIRVLFRPIHYTSLPIWFFVVRCERSPGHAAHLDRVITQPQSAEESENKMRE